MKIILNLDSLNSFYTINIRLIFLLGEWVGGMVFSHVVSVIMS